jgi:Flp pilus assembly protein TadB
MNDEELQQRERELKEREHALRLRELEAEIAQKSQPEQVPVSPTTRHSIPEKRFQLLRIKGTRILTFLGLVVATIVTIKVASSLTTIVFVGIIALVIYSLVFGFDRRDRH